MGPKQSGKPAEGHGGTGPPRNGRGERRGEEGPQAGAAASRLDHQPISALSCYSVRLYSKYSSSRITSRSVAAPAVGRASGDFPARRFHPRVRAFLEQHPLGGRRVDAVRLARRTHGLTPLVPRRPRGPAPSPRPPWPCACCLCAAACVPLLAWRLSVRRRIPRPPACAGSRDVEPRIHVTPRAPALLEATKWVTQRALLWLAAGGPPSRLAPPPSRPSRQRRCRAQAAGRTGRAATTTALGPARLDPWRCARRRRGPLARSSSHGPCTHAFTHTFTHT